MELIISIFFGIFAIMFLLLALFEERDTNNVSKEEEEKSTNLILIFMSLSLTLFFIAGVCMLYATETYYSVDNDTIMEIDLPSYRPLSYIFFGLAILDLILISKKVFDYLELQREEG